jgi:5'-deoxynucleotidase YfbR-like HD superfamily hydrolase
LKHALVSRTTLEQIEALYDPIARIEPIQNGAGVVASSINLIISSGHDCPLRIKGAVGSGKTLFLQTLYDHIYRRFLQDVTTPVPVFVDIKHYDQISDDPNEMIQALRNDLLPLTHLLTHFPDRTVALFIDSIDHHASHREAIEQEFLRILAEKRNVRSISAVGVHSASHVYRKLPGRLNDSESTIRLRAIDGTENRILEFLNAIAALWGEQDNKRFEQVQQWLRVFDMNEIDFLTAFMMYDMAKSSEVEQITSLAVFYEMYCNEYLEKQSIGTAADSLLAKAGEMAHQYFIQRLPVKHSSHKPSRALWNLIHYHVGIQRFLIARHVVESLQRFETNQPSLLEVLNHVYPQPVDRFCKDIMTRTVDTEFQCIGGARRLATFLRKKPKRYWEHLKAGTQACYMMGRVKSSEAQYQAAIFLREQLAEAQSRSLQFDVDDKLAEYRKPHLLYERTIFISLAYLGDGDASKKYVKHLIEDHERDMLNRGFHLEYYRDIISVDDTDQMLHVDKLQPFPKTRASLVGRIDRALEGGSRALLDIELFTLLSLCQHRHAAGALEREILAETKGIIDRSIKYVTEPMLRQYMEMLVKVFTEPIFPVGRIAEQLYGLKAQMRMGWKARGLPEIDCESVADHTFGALLLAALFLPEKATGGPLTWRNYDKAQVMKYLFIHDLAEAFTGDLLPDQRDQRARDQEEEWFEYLQMLSTYPGVNGLDSVFELWDDFENKKNLNAAIAVDLDKLENLMQLYIYQRRQQPLERAKDLEIDLISQIKTDAGIQILKVIQAWGSPRLQAKDSELVLD